MPAFLTIPSSDRSIKRYCRILQLPDDEELIRSYESIHRPESIWPEIPRGIRAAGIERMDIFRQGRTAVMIIDIDEGLDLQEVFSRLSSMDRQAEWEAYVSRLQAADPEARSEEKWREAHPIFSLSDSSRF